MRPHSIGRTTAAPRGGVVTGLPDMGPVNVVREEPTHRPALRGTERAVYVSMTMATVAALRQNMRHVRPRFSCPRGDLVVARTAVDLDHRQHPPLRELAQAAGGAAHLFGPPAATRVRWNMFSDTPLRRGTGGREPAGRRDSRLLPRRPAESRDRSPGWPRRDGSPPLEPRRRGSDRREHAPLPTYWFRPPQRIATTAGHIACLGLRYPPPPGRCARSRSPPSTATRRAARSGLRHREVSCAAHRGRRSSDGPRRAHGPRWCHRPSGLQAQNGLSMAATAATSAPRDPHAVGAALKGRRGTARKSASRCSG